MGLSLMTCQGIHSLELQPLKDVTSVSGCSTQQKFDIFAFPSILTLNRNDCCLSSIYSKATERATFLALQMITMKRLKVKVLQQQMEQLVNSVFLMNH